MDGLHAQLEMDGIPDWFAAQPRSTSCLRLPKGIAVLTGLGHWPSFAVCDLFQGRYRGWHLGHVRTMWDDLPAARWQAAQITNSIVTPTTTSEAADCVRELVSLVHAQAAVGELHDTLRRLHEVVSCMQAHVDEASEAFDIDGITRSRNNRAFNVYFLLNCFWLSGILKNDQSLRDALELSCRIILPKTVASAILDMFNKFTRPIPHASTVSRLRMKVDTAYMMCTRDTIQSMMGRRHRRVSHGGRVAARRQGLRAHVVEHRPAQGSTGSSA